MRIALLVLACLFHTPMSWAWGKTGHRVAAEIATRYLSPRARIAVERILGSERLPRASTWPDFMRSDPSEFWQEKAGPWHYVTVPEGKRYEEVGPPPVGDAYTALQCFGQTLTDPDSSPGEQARALRFAVHIVADLHQPLHAGNGTDRGGNDFRIEYFGRSTDLHDLWDWQMIDRMQLSYSELSEWLLADLDADDFSAWNDPDPLAWIAESTELRDRIYPAERELGWDYGFKWREAVYRRLSQAGIRTAAWLNAVFDTPAKGGARKEADKARTRSRPNLIRQETQPAYTGCR